MEIEEKREVVEHLFRKFKTSTCNYKTDLVFKAGWEACERFNSGDDPMEVYIVLNLLAPKIDAVWVIYTTLEKAEKGVEDLRKINKTTETLVEIKKGYVI